MGGTCERGVWDSRLSIIKSASTAQTMDDKKLTTLVLIDATLDSGPRKGRPARESSWHLVLEPHSYIQQSVADSRRSGESVRINEFGSVIVNWDAANGDIVTGSDDTLFYFMTRGGDRKEAFLRKGGRLLCEFQGGMGRLHQAAYDALFGDNELEVISLDAFPEEKWHGSEAEVWSRTFSRFHPVLNSLPKTFRTAYRDEGERLFNFVDGPVTEMYGYKYRETIFWHGWFRWWQKGWIPLLKAKLPKDHPYRTKLLAPKPAVLLAKCTGNGVMFASTMWLALSRSKDLMDSILRVDVASIQRAHNRLKWYRRVIDALIAVTLVFAGRALMIAWPVALRWEGSGKLIEDFGKTWFYILLALFYIQWIWRRPYGVSPLKSFVPALRSLRSFFGFGS